jgi:YVTN family beta-propeller protein
VDNRKFDFRILGSFEVWVGGRLVGLGGEKPRALLAILLLHHNEVVSADRLIDDLWGESPPETAASTLRAYVSRLRKALGPNGASSSEGPDSAPVANGRVLLTRGGGYVLEVAPEELDLERFRDLAERGRDALAAGRPDEAAAALREALGMWRGPPLAELAYEPFAQGVIAQLEELHVAAVEDRVEADLALGRARELVGELRDLVAHHPLRERLRGQLMLALYRSGRQAEALEAYQLFRQNLSEELGLEPGPPVQRLELSILNRDPALDCATGDPVSDTRGQQVGAATAPGAAAGTVHRRRLTVSVGAAVLLVLVLAAVVMAARGGRATHGRASRPTTIPGDAVGAISSSSGAIRAVVSLRTSPSSLAAGDGGVWVANANVGTVSRIDPRTRAVVETIPVGSSPSGIAVGPRAVWVTNNGIGTVARIDPAVDRVVQTIPVGNAPAGVAVGHGSVWVANSSDGTLSRIDAVTGALTDTIALGGAGATGVAVGAGAVWVSDEAGDRVLRVDPHSDQVTAVIHVGTGPTAIAVGFGSVWVANSLDGTVSRINPVTDGVASTIAAGDGAGAIALSRDAVWITSQYAGTVSRISPATDVVARTIAVGNRPQALAVSGGLVWVGARAADTGHRGGTLNTLSSAWPDTVDPVRATLGVGPLELTNNGLTAYQHVGGSGSEQVVPDLAVSLPSPTDGGATYTFRLRRGIHFSDGELVRPEDFRRALERDLILGPDPLYGAPFANVIGGAACAAHPSRCDLSRGVVTDDATNTVTFHLVAPDPEFLARLTLTDAVAVPADAPLRDVGLHPLPATGPYKWASLTQREATLVRNPYFHEWSHAARPDGYPDRIVYRLAANSEAEINAIERDTADYSFDGVPPDRHSELQTRFASQLFVTPAPATDELVLNTRVAPFDDIRVRRALNYAVDRAKVTRLLGQYNHPSCQALPPYLPGYRPYCPYTLEPNPAGVWHAPNLAEAERLIAASHTKGTPVTIWNLGASTSDESTVEPYLVSLLDQLGYPTTVRDVSADPNAPRRFADSRTREQAALTGSNPWYLSASQIIQANFACQSFLTNSTGNANTSEFCDRHLDAQITSALSAESDNAPDTATLWAQADRTVTDQAPIVALTIPSNVYLVSARVHNYEISFQQGPLLDQFWLR